MRTSTPRSDALRGHRQVAHLMVVPDSDEPPSVQVTRVQPEAGEDAADQAGTAQVGRAPVGRELERVTGPSAERVLLWAEQLLTAHGPGIAGRWARAIAMLARQALELVLAERCASALPGARSAAVGHPAGSSMAPDVHRVVGDELLTARIDNIWRTLSRACAQPDETAPTAAQLRRWLDSVRAIETALTPRTPPA